MSEQGGEYAATSSTPATGVDGGFLGEPERQGDGSSHGLDRIYERMEQMSAQQQAIVDALSVPEEIEDDEIDWENLDDEELAEALGVTPDELAEALAEYREAEEYGEADEYVPARDVFELINDSIDARMADADAERAEEQRDEDFEDLRERLPLLQHEPTARAIVEQAVQLAESYDPRLIGGPGSSA